MACRGAAGILPYHDRRRLRGGGPCAAEDVQRLLKEKPEGIRGIAVAGMPLADHPAWKCPMGLGTHFRSWRSMPPATQPFPKLRAGRPQTKKMEIMMKKLMTGLSAIALIGSLAGCSGADANRAGQCRDERHERYGCRSEQSVRPV